MKTRASKRLRRCGAARRPSCKGVFLKAPWRGRSDVLLRVQQPQNTSAFGNWSYEVVDCKLARNTKTETILQLCLYSELLAGIQGFAPEFFYVIRPGVSFEPESYRLASFGAYYRVVKRALQEAVNTELQETYPEPVNLCEICRWWKECDRRRRGDDHLSFVAGASKLQRKELTLQGVGKTIRGFASRPVFSSKRGRKAHRSSKCFRANRGKDCSGSPPRPMETFSSISRVIHS
jgi:predicted RecB family nuclease